MNFFYTPESFRTYSIVLSEYLSEITYVIETARDADLSYLHIGSQQKLSGIYEPVLVKVIYRLFPYYIPEAPETLAFAYIS